MFPLKEKTLIRGCSGHKQAGLGCAADYRARYVSLFAPGFGFVKSYWGTQGGLWIVITLNNGDEIHFAHNDKVYKTGSVKEGDLIGKTGNSGKLTTGPHLHVHIIRDGVRINPETYDWFPNYKIGLPLDEVRVAESTEVKTISVKIRDDLIQGIVRKFGEVRPSYTAQGWKGHTGIDIFLNVGAGVYAVRDGFVSNFGKDSANALFVEIDHGDFITRYWHLKKYLVIGFNQVVKRGELIGIGGRTGRVDYPHLHFEVRVKKLKDNGYGGSVDPVPYMVMKQLTGIMPTIDMFGKLVYDPYRKDSEETKVFFLNPENFTRSHVDDPKYLVYVFGKAAWGEVGAVLNSEFDQYTEVSPIGFKVNFLQAIINLIKRS